jgi:hypothetical protein
MSFTNQNTNAYKAMVERRLAIEGKPATDFVLHERKWGTRIPNMPIVVHNKDGIDVYYLEVIFLKPGISYYEFDGVQINPSAIIGLPPAREEAEQGNLSNKVILRDFKAESITELRIDGKVVV